MKTSLLFKNVNLVLIFLSLFLLVSCCSNSNNDERSASYNKQREGAASENKIITVGTDGQTPGWSQKISLAAIYPPFSLSDSMTTASHSSPILGLSTYITGSFLSAS